jgi:uncharacterized protein
MKRTIAAILLIFGGAATGHAQTNPPVIDVHVHSTNTPVSAWPRLEAANVRYVVLSSLASDLTKWVEVDSSRYLPSLVFPCDRGRAPFTGMACYPGERDLPDLEWLRRELAEGRIRGFGEMAPQFFGMSPADRRLMPYWSLAEEFDIPVAIHMGSGPPGAAYDDRPGPFKSPEHRMAYSDPMLLEEVLLRHRRLRMSVMHAGWPRLESMLALLYAHPRVYVDLGSLHDERVAPRAEFERYVRGLVTAGFGSRIMFGSDFPDALQPGIDAVLSLEFLTAQQKADILCGNAARFLRLDSAVCRP